MRHAPVLRPGFVLLFPVALAGVLSGVLAAVQSAAPPDHPRLFFSQDEVAAIRERAETPALKPSADRLVARAQWVLTAPPIVPSLARRGEPDPPGESKGIDSARRMQGRVATLALAFRLYGDRRFRDAAVTEMRRAIDEWRIWVDTAHQPPFDLMTGEISATLAIGYDWLHADLSPDERALLQRGAERALTAYLAAIDEGRSWFTRRSTTGTPSATAARPCSRSRCRRCRHARCACSNSPCPRWTTTGTTSPTTAGGTRAPGTGPTATGTRSWPRRR